MFTEIQKKNCIEQSKDLSIAVVYTKWHVDIVHALLEGAKREAFSYGIGPNDIHCFEVSGAFELSQMVHALAKSQKFDAIVPLGCLIKGETLHYELIAQTIAQSFDEIGRTFSTAVSFGVLTVDTQEQAKQRAGGSLGNKGMEATSAAIELALSMKGLQ